MRKKVGKFILLNTIGRGACGKVKLAYHEDSSEEFAVKILKKRHIKDRLLTENVRKEVAVMNILDHPSIVKLHQVLTTREHVYMVMELVTGGELYDEIMSTELGGLEEQEARRYFRQLIEGVAHCHSEGIYHRDLKPENLLLDDNDRLKITDFGFSNLKQGMENYNDIFHTQCGTPNYVAPEIICPPEDGYSGAKVDIWSCGVILYTMVAGRMPFDDKDMDQMFKKITSGIVSYPEWFSPALKNLLSGLFRVDHSKRVTLEEIQGHPWYTYAHDVEEAVNGVTMIPKLGLMDIPLLAKTKSMNLGNDQDIDAGSDGVSNRQASDFTDYTLDLSVSEFGKIVFRNDKGSQGSRFNMKKQSATDSSARNGRSGLSLNSRASQTPSSHPDKTGLSSSTDSEDTEGNTFEEEVPRNSYQLTVACVTCGATVEQAPNPTPIQHICENCSRRSKANWLIVPVGPRTTVSNVFAKEAKGQTGETIYASLDEEVFRHVLERGESVKQSAGGSGDMIEILSDSSFHMLDEWEAGCLQELEEHGRSLQVLNSQWSARLSALKDVLQENREVSQLGEIPNAASDLKLEGKEPEETLVIGRGKHEREPSPRRRSTILNNPSRPWISASRQVIGSDVQSEDERKRNILRDPFVGSGLISGVGAQKARSDGTDFLPDPCREQALQETTSTSMSLAVLDRAPVTPTATSVPRVIEGLRTLKHKGQQRKFFDSLCSPPLLSKILNKILKELSCESQVREFRNEEFKISTTLRPPQVHAMLTTKIEIYRKSDALSKVSVRKIRGTRQDFVSFFGTVKDRYAQRVHNLL